MDEWRRCVSGENETTKASLKIWVAALLASLLLFYLLDHLVMSIQGLPLAWDLTAAK